MRRKKNAGNIAPLILMAVAVFGIVVFIWCKVFVVRNIVIECQAVVSQEEIIRAAKVDMGGHISKVDEEALKANLESGGAFVLEDVRTKYPSTVILSIRQRTRDAIVRNGGKYLVLDSDGYVIEANDVMLENSGVYVYGLNASDYRIGGQIAAPEENLWAMKVVLDAVRNQNAAQFISDVTVSDVENIMITTRTGLRVKLGDCENMENKILWLRSAVSDLESRGNTRGTLDVSSGTKADYMP